VPFDLAGNARVVDDPATEDTGVPSAEGATVDIGAVEFHPRPCPADVNGNGGVGFGDVVGILLAWGPCDYCDEDIDCSGEVGLFDLTGVLQSWGACPEV
jgi:hypothetical protein